MSRYVIEPGLSGHHIRIIREDTGDLLAVFAKSDEATALRVCEWLNAYEAADEREVRCVV